MDTKKEQLFLVAYCQVLGVLQKHMKFCSVPCALQLSLKPVEDLSHVIPWHLYLGEKRWRRKLIHYTAGVPMTLLYGDICHSCLLPSTVGPEAKRCYISIESSSSQTKHLDLVDTRNVLIYYKLDPHCTGINPGTLPDE